MRTIESRDQFRQEAQTMLLDIEQRLNDLNQASDDRNASLSEEQSEEINRLKNQHRNLKEALEKYGTVGEDEWSTVQQDIENIFEEANSAWREYPTNQFSKSSWNDTKEGNQSDQNAQYQRSTGQSDHGDSGNQAGIGDRGGMENNRGNSRAYDDSDTINNQEEREDQYRWKSQMTRTDNSDYQENTDYDENIDEESGIVGQNDSNRPGMRNQMRDTEDHTTAASASVTWDYGDHAGFTNRSSRSQGINQGEQGPAVDNDYSDQREGVKSDRSSNWTSTQSEDNQEDNEGNDRPNKADYSGKKGEYEVKKDSEHIADPKTTRDSRSR